MQKVSAQNSVCRKDRSWTLQALIKLQTNQYDMPATWGDVWNKLEACLVNIGAWMSASKLILKTKGTELVTFKLKHQLKVNEKT